MKRIMKLIIVLLCFITLTLFLINIVEGATKPKGSMSVVEFGKKDFESLNTYTSVKDVNLLVRFINTEEEDLARMASSRNFCIHWYNVYNPDDPHLSNYLERETGDFKIKYILDINWDNNFVKARRLGSSNEFATRLNGLMAYIAYYGMNDSTGFEKDGVYGDEASDTLNAFRYFYTSRTSWRNGLKDELGILTYAEHSEGGINNTVYEEANTYAEFLNTNKSIKNIKKLSAAEPTVNGSYIGPFKVNYASDGTEEYINNKTICKVDGKNYSGKFYTLKSNGEYLENKKVPKNKEFYISVADASNVEKVVFTNSYYVYRARIFFFVGGWTQTNITVTGKRDQYSSNVEYEIANGPEVTIDKRIIDLNGTTKDTTSINAQPGDTVIFKVTVENTGGSTKINLADTIPAGLTLQGTKAKSSESWSKSWNGLSNVEIGKDKKIVRYFKCTVNENATGKITNTAEVSSPKGYKLNQKGDSKKEASAIIKVLGYSYSLNKKVDKTSVEPGDTVEYTITLTNNNDTHLHNVIMTDTIPKGVEYVSWSATTSVKQKWDVNVSGKTLTFTMKTDKSMGKGKSSFVITCKVPNNSIYTTDKSVTNTIYLKQVQNRNNLNLDTKKSSVTTTILGYNYDISKVVSEVYKSDNSTKTGSTTVAEPGDLVLYKITIKNTGSGELHNIKVEDIIPEGMTYFSKSSNLSKDGNIFMYNGSLAAGKTVNIYIKAKVNNTVSNTTHTETNTVKIATVENKNNVDITTVKDSSVSITVLGYDATLNKYITKHNGKNVSGRKSKTNKEKYDKPVVMKKGDTFTYTILFKNTGTEKTTGNTTLYSPEIVDVLPTGIEYVSHSDGWTKSGDTYKYNNNVGIGKEVKLEINCKVTMSNMHLLNIENTGTFGIVNNRNKVNTRSVLKTQENKEYIRLDELNIAGNVWNDANKNGYKQSEDGISGVDVILYDVTENKEYARTKTDSNGNYSFNKVQKGTLRDKNGNYVEKSKYKQYYIEFKYNGVIYQSVDTKYKSTENINSDGTYVEKYKVDSNASEIKVERDNFNKSLETIAYNKATGNGETKELTYNKIHDESILDKSKLQTTDSVKMSAYSFLDNNDNKQLLWLYSENILQETDYLKYINLGLYKREEKADLELESTLESQTKTINGQRQISYRPEEYNSSGRIENHQSSIYWTDYYYDIDQVYKDMDINGDGNPESLENIRNYKTIDSETNLEVTFKTKITNKSTGVDAVIREVAQYYDENFETVYEYSDGIITPFRKTLKIDRDDNGEFNNGPNDSADYTYEFKVGYRVVKYDADGNDTLGNQIKYDNSIVKLSNNYEDYIHKNNAGTLMNGLQVLYLELQEDVLLKPEETLEIYTNYIVKKEPTTNRLILDKYELISEINAYSTYFTNTKNPSGTVDIDSNPGNLGMKEGVGNVTPGVKISERKYYEDDTCRSSVTLSLTKDDTSGRRIKGTVWDDGKMGESADGVYNEGEPGIEGVKAQLYEVIKVGNEYFEIPAIKVVKDSSGNRIYQEITTVTNSDGSYELKGFFPGLYIVRFTYGYNPNADLKYNGQDYKSTIYNLNDTNNFEASNNNRQTIGPSTTKELPFNSISSDDEENLYNVEKASEVRYSDARDDEQRRLEVMEYSVEMYNEKAEVLKNRDIADSKANTLVDETYMFADTATFIAKNENTSRSKNADGSEDEDVLICIGQLKEGTSYWVESSVSESENDKKFIIKNGGAKHSGTKHLWNAWSSKDKNIDPRNITTYKRSYVIENVDFGLVLRPENKIELKKYIKQITLESSSGDVIADLHYNIYNNDNTLKLDSNGILQPELNTSLSKGYKNVQSLNNTNTHKGFRYLNVDEELLQGAKLGIKYGFVVINNSDKDYISSKLYGDEVAIQDLTTAEVINEISTKMGAIGLKQKHENNYYGYYLGNWYYTGYEDINNNGRLDIPEDLNDNGILDPGEDIDNDGVLYIDEDKDGDRRLDTNEDLNGNGVLDPGEDIDNDGRLDVDEDLNGNGVLDTDEDLNGNGILDPTTDVEATIKIDNILDYVDNSLVFSPTDNEGKWGTMLNEELINRGYLNKNVSTEFIQEDGTPIELIADISNVVYQTDTKNNLAVTKDNQGEGTIFKHLLTKDNVATANNIENRAETELYVSTFLSAENESDDMVYENIAEIIKFTTLTGRRTVSTQTVGNAKVHEVGYRNDDDTLKELDTSITEKVMLTPPTGADWIDTYVLTRVVIYVVCSIGVIVLGILFIPKLATKINNRKFIR